jgi:hypothetical protein
MVIRVQTRIGRCVEIRHLPRGIEVMLLANVNFTSFLELFIVKGVLTLVTNWIRIH